MLTIDSSGAWRLYSPLLPAGATPFGAVRRGTTDTGALIQLRSGIFVQANAGVMRTLPQREVREALGAQQ